MVRVSAFSTCQMNVDLINIDEYMSTVHDGCMTTYVSATEAARMLGVTKPTRYANVIRGIVCRSTAVDGRRSLYARDEIERLAGRTRSRRDTSRATIDVQISSAITTLSDERVTYRGRDAADLARAHTFEEVSELLWTDELGAPGLRWPVDRDALARCKRVDAEAGATDSFTRLALAATTLSGGVDGGVVSAASAARRLLAIAPSLLGGPVTGDIASRLAAVYRRRPPDELVEVVSRALVLLADHELATSTLAVRVACSVRADPYAAIAVGLNVVGGPLHGTASTSVAAVLDDALANGAKSAVDRVLSAG